MTMKQNILLKLKEFLIPIATLLLILFIIPIYIYIINNWVLLNWEEKGQFGDMFGALNAILTGVAFTATVITLRMQMKDIRNSHIQAERANTISALQSYIESHNTDNPSEEVNIAKSILKKLTEDILLDEKYADCYTPIIKISKCWKLKNNDIRVEFINEGPELLFSTLEEKHDLKVIGLTSGATQSTLNGIMKRQSRYAIDIKLTENISFEIKLRLLNTMVFKSWILLINVDYIGSKHLVTSHKITFEQKRP